ncbi:aminotransferase class V-fold PLP-dependent enzyme [Canibacter sp. lx-45]|uniref:aminotransferase class V-fold PLP-dependent enzyme n=1 Tax=Canibacter zhuwentaonis TaxID=2837491 RepID=UPI001BDCF322|nr:aminotransferase class V-fold PLP-dependent enzyme [Canibacter zhuwentaonis]MBT1034769.1 aminotransferase class V-fold PLP-dependent enzyme [Canibacter zhuwentaonis]
MTELNTTRTNSQGAVFETAKIARIRADFPYFKQIDELKSRGEKHSSYLDTAATSQRVARALLAEHDFTVAHTAAVHRGTSFATGEASLRYENARAQIAKFLGSSSLYTLVFTGGATDAINTLATAISEASLAVSLPAPQLAVAGSDRFVLARDDEILVPVSEHHANLIPWQRLAARTGAKLVTLPVDENGLWRVAELRERLSARTKIVAFAHVSNVTGHTVEVADTVQAVKHASPDAITVLDACQSVPHLPFNASENGADFIVFSGHKMFGPNGVGGLLGKTELLDALPPARTGGSAITLVTPETTEFLPPPYRFEPGTGAVSQAIALAAATEYLQELGMHNIAKTEEFLVSYLLDKLRSVSGLRIIGEQHTNARAALVSLNLDGVHPHDVGQVLDSLGVIARVGHHCAQPLHRALGITASVRCSVSCATTQDEIDAFVTGLKEAQKYFLER